VLARRSDLGYLVVDGLYGVASVHLTRHELPSAREILQQALQEARNRSHRLAEARILIALGKSYLRVLDGPSVLNFAGQALTLAERGGYRREQATALWLLGMGNDLQARFTEARRLYEEALRQSEIVEDQHQRSIAVTALCNLAVNHEDFAEADRLAQISLDAGRQGDNLSTLCYRLLDSARTAWRVGDMQRSESLLAEIPRLSLLGPDAKAAVDMRVLMNRADLLVESGGLYRRGGAAGAGERRHFRARPLSADPCRSTAGRRAPGRGRGRGPGSDRGQVSPPAGIRSDLLCHRPCGPSA
jgi:tetratricopeptide (TPR) repeat protein